jgi:hypothetical protein
MAMLYGSEVVEDHGASRVKSAPTTDKSPRGATWVMTCDSPVWHRV